jgi:hypothetical protein
MLPEEQELTRLEIEQSELEEQVASAELMLETLNIELLQFQRRYYFTGSLFVELDKLDAQIAWIEAEQNPDDKVAQIEAKAAQQQAQRSAEEVGDIDKCSPSRAEITPEIKQAFRMAAKLMHPDRATTEGERARRNVMMVQVNVAYEQGDLNAIENLITEFGHDPEAIQGDDIGSRLVKTIRRKAQLRRRLSMIQIELAEQRQHELYELMTSITETASLESDLLNDLIQDLKKQIAERNIQLKKIRQEITS